MGECIIFTKEELQEYKRLTLKLLLEGLPDTEIANQIGLNSSTIRKYRNQLCQDEETRKQVDSAREKRKEEKKEARIQKVLEGLLQGKSREEICKDNAIGEDAFYDIRRTLLERGDITLEKEEEKGKKNTSLNYRKANILERLRRGETSSEMEEYLTIGKSRINGIIRELKRDNYITQEEIEEARSKRKVNSSNTAIISVEIGEELQERVLELLQYGLRTEKICEILEINNHTFTIIRDNILGSAELNMSNETIKEARENRIKADKEMICMFRMQGYKLYREMVEKIPYATQSYIDFLAKELRKENQLPDKQQVLEAQYDKNEKRKLDLVRQGLLQGFTCQEIIDSDEQHELTESMIYIRQKKLVEDENEEINEDIIREARAKRAALKAKQKRENYEGPNDKKVLELFKLGFNRKDIATIIGVNPSMISYIKKRLLENGSFSSTGEVDEYINSREERAEKRRNRLKNMQQYKEDIDIEVYNEQLRYAKIKNQLGTVEPIDIELLSQVMPMEQSLINIPDVKLFVKYFINNRQSTKAIRFLNQCLESMDNEDSRRDILVSAKSAILAKQNMKSSGTVAKYLTVEGR